MDEMDERRDVRSMKIKENWHLPDHKQAAKRTKEEVETVSGLDITENQKQLSLIHI